jgi:cysteine desulfurase
MFGSKRIYLDYASATPADMKALEAAQRESAFFGNPGGIHQDSVDATASLTRSRGRIAAHLGCKAREIVFTSGLTESNGLAILGAARAIEARKRSLKDTHWLVSSIEHSSVLECFAEIERQGGTVDYIEPDKNGSITTQAVEKKLRPETVFVSVGWGNNEIGVVQPLADIARVLRLYERRHKAHIIFHSDAGQAPLYLSPNVHSLKVDLLSLGSGKLYGPRGSGCLYTGTRADLAAVSFGGGQERGLRSGTEDVALAAGFAEAFDIVKSERAAEAKRLRKLRDDFARELIARIPGTLQNGTAKHMLPHMLNVSIPGKKTGEYLVLQLDRAGFSLSTKSACREGEASSRVVEALGVAEGAPKADWRAKNTLRFSLGRDTTAKDLKRLIEALAPLVSPRV